MLLFADEVEVPHGMVEDHQHIRFRIERGENLSQPAFLGVRGVVLEDGDPFLRMGTGQIVDAEVERLLAIGRAPFQRNRNLPGAGNGSQKHGRVDVVVVGDGYHGVQVQRLDLGAFEIEGQPGSHGWGPVGCGVVDPDPVQGLRTALHARQERSQHGKLVAEIGEKIQCLRGLVSVAM